MGKTPLLDVVFAFAKTAHFIPAAEGLKKVLNYQGFEKHLPQLIEQVLNKDEKGVPVLFSLPERAAAEILEAGVRSQLITPVQIVDSTSEENYFTRAASSKSETLLEKLTELFPAAFTDCAPVVIEELIVKGCNRQFVETTMMRYLEKGGEIPYQALWSQLAQYRRPNQAFLDAFETLTDRHKKLLYQAAFTYNNPFFYEPAAVPIDPSAYSINLMWINEKRIPDDQSFLLGFGYHSEDEKADFHNRFVRPVAAWAEKNPSSSINIWVDSAMATYGAIERSRAVLDEFLEGKPHGTIAFRNVRDIPRVSHEWPVFMDSRPIYFRVDLLRAIAADHVLSERETQYFVYGDLDMKPLSGDELFDQRTIDFLNECGFVMAKGGHLGFENGFQIFNGHHLHFMLAHYEQIILANIEKANRAPSMLKEQQVYDSYPAMWTLLQSFQEDLAQKAVPTKPVQLPPSHFG